MDLSDKQPDAMSSAFTPGPAKNHGLELNRLVRLMSLLQLTKEQPLTGYLSAGIKLHETATLAEHHYTTALSAFFVCGELTRAGAKLNSEQIVAMCLIHDLGELFGGDIAGPLNRKYGDLRELKDKIAKRAISILADYLTAAGRGELMALFEEYEFGGSDEALVARIMDQMDHQFFLEHHKYETPSKGVDYRPRFIKEHIEGLVEQIRDPVAHAYLARYLTEFNQNFLNQGFDGLALLME